MTEFSDTPLNRSKEDYLRIISKIESDSNVGIDAQFTHAVIIEHLQRIEKRLDQIEKKLG